jgi:hypothetical protein
VKGFSESSCDTLQPEHKISVYYSIGQILDHMIHDGKVKVGEITYSLVVRKYASGEEKYMLCDGEVDGIKYFIGGDINDFIKLFENKQVEMI